MSTVVMIVWDSINAVLIPWEYDKIEKGKIEDIKELTRVLILIYAVICTGIMFVAPEAVKLFTPSSYYAGIYVMAPVIGGTFLTDYSVCCRYWKFITKNNLRNGSQFRGSSFKCDTQLDIYSYIWLSGSCLHDTNIICILFVSICIKFKKFTFVPLL